MSEPTIKFYPDAYSRIMAALANTVHNFAPRYFGHDITVIDKDTMIDQLPYPYISIDIINDDIQVTATPLSGVFECRIQMVAVSNNKYEAKRIGKWLREMSFFNQPLADLLKIGIQVAGYPQSVPNTSDFIDNFKEYTAGADYYFVVKDDVNDLTQLGVIQNTSINKE